MLEFSALNRTSIPPPLVSRNIIEERVERLQELKEKKMNHKMLSSRTDTAIAVMNSEPLQMSAGGLQKTSFVDIQSWKREGLIGPYPLPAELLVINGFGGGQVIIFRVEGSIE